MSSTFYEGPGSSADWDLKMPGEPGYRTAEQVIADEHGDARVGERVPDAPAPHEYGAGLEVGRTPLADDDDDEGTGPAAPAGSVLERLRSELGRKVTPTYTVPIPDHPTIELVVRTDWSEETFRKWQAKAKDRRAPDGVSNSKLVRAMLAQQTVRIVFDGTTMTEDGIPWTFKHPACQREFSANTPEQAVHYLLPSYPQLISVGNEVSEAAGKGSMVSGDADPF